MASSGALAMIAGRGPNHNRPVAKHEPLTYNTTQGAGKANWEGRSVMVRVGRALLAAVVLASLVGTERQTAAREPATLVQATARAKAGGLEVHAGGLVLRPGAAGSAFGAVRKGKGKLELSYFVLL